jgi:hypothetical protein
VPMEHFTFDVLGEAYGEQAVYARQLVCRPSCPPTRRTRT